MDALDRERIAEKARYTLAEVEELKSLLEMVISRTSDDSLHDDDITVPVRVAAGTKLKILTSYLNNLERELKTQKEQGNS